MRITTGLFSVCLMIICFLAAACTAQYPIRAADLTARFTEPFVCGFQAENTKTGIPIYGTISRTADGDILTVTGTYGNTAFSFSGNRVALLCVGASGDEKQIPLSLPPDADIAAIRGLFFRIPDDRDTAQRTQNGITVTAADGTELCFSDDGTPVRISNGNHTVTIQSFQTEAS